MVFDDKVKKVSSYTVTSLANIIKGMNMSEERTVKKRGTPYSVLLTKHYSDYLIKNKEMVGHVASMGARKGAYRALEGKPEGRRPLGRPRHRWKENIKTDLREVGWWVMD